MTELENLLRDITQKVKQLEIIRDAVLLGCDPPNDCNDPVVLKTYMKGCFDQAIREYPK